MNNNKNTIIIFLVLLITVFVSHGRCYTFDCDKSWEMETRILEAQLHDGCENADVELGFRYYYGYRAKRDVSKGLGIIESLSNEENPIASIMLGKIYKNGLNGFDVDTIRANDLFNSAQSALVQMSASGNPIAQYHLGEMYMYGLGIGKSTVDACQLYLQSALQGYVPGEDQVGACYAEGGLPLNKRLGFEWFEKAAEKKLPIALYHLGLCYETGSGVPQDNKKSIEWYEKAADLDVDEAQYELGIRYETGDSFEMNYKKAYYWYERSANNGNSNAQLALGGLYEYGSGISKNLQMAVHWFQKSSRLGNPKAHFYLATCYDFGKGVEVDKVKAISLYNEAIKNGVIKAKVFLAQLYYFGDGIGLNKSIAIELLNDSNLVNDVDAMVIRGLIKIYGDENSRDTADGIKLLENAAEIGSLNALYKLGCFYATRDTLRASKLNAMKYLNAAAEYSFEPAITALDTFDLFVESEGGAIRDYKTMPPEGWTFPNIRDVESSMSDRKNNNNLYLSFVADINGDKRNDSISILINKKQRKMGVFAKLSGLNGYSVNLLYESDIKFLNRIGISSIPPGKHATACAKGYGSECAKNEPREIKLTSNAIGYFYFESSSYMIYWNSSKRRFDTAWLSD